MAKVPIFNGLTEEISDRITEQVQPLVDNAQEWAEGTEPGGPGTKSAKGHALDAAASAAGVSMARGPYAATADGLTATTNGQRFWAISGEWLQLYTNSAGSAVAVAGYITPLKTWADARFGETSDPWALESADGFIIARAAADRTFRVNWPLMLGSSMLSETAGVLRAGSLYSKDSPAVAGLQFVSDDGFVLMSTTGLFNTITME